MNKDEKQLMINDLSKRLDDNSVIYIADISDLDAVATSALRRQCFAKNIKLSVVKNTLLKKAMENVQGKDFTELYDVLPGPTAIMLSDTGNLPAKLIKDFSFKHIKLKQIVFPVVEEHVAAMRLYKKTGFTLKKETNKTLIKDGKSFQLVEWSMNNPYITKQF